MNDNGIQTQPTADAADKLETKPKPAALPAPSGDLNEAQLYELIQRRALGYARSDLVPAMYREKWVDGKNLNPSAVANCIIALNLASQLGANELMVMQNLYPIEGRPSWSSIFLIATFNRCGRFSAIRYEFVGKEGSDEWGCRASAVEKSTGETLIGTLITMGMAKKEGWTGRKGSKWLTIPEQMLMYRSGAWFVRAYAPELSMGLPTADEVEDTVHAPVAAHVMTDSELVERRNLLESVARVTIERPANVAIALGYLGLNADTNPERLPLDQLRALWGALRPLGLPAPIESERIETPVADGSLFEPVKAARR